MTMREELEALDAELRRWTEDRDFSGSVLLTEAGRTTFEGCYGLADRANRLPVTPATRFALASVTKMFTACTVVGLVNADRLAFDTRLVDVLPASARPTTLHPDVTVHHLLTHTSGIADYAEEDEDTPGYVEDYASLWVDRPVSSMLRPIDFLPMFGDREPYRRPGERCQYSNAGYVLLGILVEEVTRRPFTDVVQELVLDPAGMTASGFFRLDEPRPDTAHGYLRRSSSDAPSRTNIYSVPVVGGADGGAFSTTGDLVRFLRAVDDGTLLGPSRDRVLARHAEIGDGFAFGYGVLHYPDGRFGHGGGDPGVEVLVARWPEADAELVVLCNMEDLAGEARDLVLDVWRG
jgi:CubicO group peptidase (beta-lactamase class C family)